MTLTVYQGKPSKNVIILSSMHKDVAISQGQKKLPETVEYYNATKYGVDIIDQMARQQSTKVASRRWPLQIFYNILDLAGINSWILFKKATGSAISRQKYLLQLMTELQDKPESVSVTEDSDSEEAELLTSSSFKHCTVICNRQKRNKTKKRCCECKAFTCGPCTAVTKIICKKCKQ